jgi:hypothetical protein
MRRVVDACDPFGAAELDDRMNEDYSWHDAIARPTLIAMPPRPCTKSSRCTRADLHLGGCDYDQTPLDLSPRYDPATGEVLP